MINKNLHWQPNASFPSTEVFFYDVTEAFCRELLKTAKPDVVERIRNQRSVLNTDTRRVFMALESRINWFFKSTRSDLKFNEPDNSIIINLGTMIAEPATDKQANQYSGSWVFSWNSNHIANSSGFSTARKDITSGLIEDCLDRLYRYEFLVLTGDDIEQQTISIGGMSRVLTGLLTPSMDNRQKTNYFTLYPSALRRITEGSSGVIFKTKLLAKLTDKSLMLLQIILRYMDRGVTPKFSYERWYSLLYTGKKETKNLLWSQFKRDDIKRHFPIIESTFKIKLDILDGKEKDNEKGFSWITIDGQKSPYVIYENSVFLEGENNYIDLDKDDYSILNKVDNQPKSWLAPDNFDEKRSSKLSSGTKRTKRTKKFSKNEIDKNTLTKLQKSCSDANYLDESQWAEFISDTLANFSLHYEKREYTPAKWKQLFIQYVKKGWQINSKTYFNLSFQDFMTDENIKNTLHDVFYSHTNLSYKKFTTLNTIELYSIVDLSKDLLKNDCESYYRGHFNSKETWQSKASKFLIKSTDFLDFIKLNKWD